MISLRSERRGDCCCGVLPRLADSPAPPQRHDATIGRRLLELAGWLIPGTLLAFFPKCPLCVAGYVALATGLGISLAAATYLRWGLLLLCIVSLTYMARGRIVQLMRALTAYR